MQTTRLWTVGRVLHRDHVLALATGDIQLGDRRRGVVDQPGVIGRIVPGLGDHSRAVAGADLVLIGLDDRVEGGGVDQALFP